MINDDEVVRLYGPWRHRTPADAVQLFNGYSGLWWIAGGWAIQAFTQMPRPHGDLDLSIPRSDVALLRKHLMSRLDVWAADNGTLRPLVGEVDEVLPSTCGNLGCVQVEQTHGSTTSFSWTQLFRRGPTNGMRG